MREYRYTAPRADDGHYASVHRVTEDILAPQELLD